MRLSVFYYDLLLILGCIITYEDWRDRKIRNRWIFTGLAICFAGYAYLFLNSILGHAKAHWFGLGELYLPWTFYRFALGHACLIIITGLVTWWLRLWPAGDAKMYILFGLMAALIDHNIRGFPLIVFLRLLINIFVPAGLWVLATVLIGSVLAIPTIPFWQLPRNILGGVERLWIRGKEIWPYRYGFAVYLLNIFIIFFVLDLLEGRFSALAFMRTPWGRIVLLAVIYLLWDPISSLLKGKRFWRTWIAIAVWWMLDPALRQLSLPVALKNTLIEMFIFGVVLTLVRSAVTFFLRQESEETMDAGELQPGMILSEKTWEKIREFGEEQNEEVPKRYADGLFPEDIAKLRRWKDLPRAVVTVYRATPFAFWVFYGTLLTLLLPKNAVYWLFRICYDPSGSAKGFLRLWGL